MRARAQIGHGRSARDVAADFLALTKPGIVRMCLLMTAGGLWLAPSSDTTGWKVWVAALIGSGLAVACHSRSMRPRRAAETMCSPATLTVPSAQA